jgi:ferritin
MLSENIVSLLNRQITFEFFSSNLYLQMSAWCDVKGLDGCAAFLRAHAREEFEHGLKLFDYVNETGTMATVSAVDAPPVEFGSVGALFQQVYDHEVLVTRRINELVSATMKEEDYSTFNFLQWYVAEQHEEEHLIQQILDKVKIIGEQGSGVFFIDKAVGELLRKS